MWLNRVQQRKRPNCYFCPSHPQEAVERAVLHELSEDHDGTGSGDDTFQVDDVGVLELTHDGRLRQEVPPLLLSVAALQRLDCHVVLLPAWDPQTTATHLTKLTWTSTSVGFTKVISMRFWKL